MNKYARTQTEKNLKAAFAGESQARNSYTFFAEIAKKEGYEQIAAIFEKTADNERAHAQMWGEELGLNAEEASEGKMVAALKRIGFDYVFDTNFAADLTIMEEGNELLERLGKLRVQEVSGVSAEFVHGKIPPADVRCHGEDLFCTEERD